MFNSFKARTVLSAAALMLAATAFGTTAAPFNAAPVDHKIPSSAPAAANADVVQVGWKRDRKYRRHAHRKHHRYSHRHRDSYVDAPYTSVDRYHGRVDVDAPFARVHRSRRGVYVRAPFVDIYIPR